MGKKIDILGVLIDSVDMESALNHVWDFLGSNAPHSIYTPNAEIVIIANKNEHFRSILNEADLLVADGAGIVLASRILGTPLPAKVSGIDLVTNIFRNGPENSKKLYFLGGKPGVAELAASNIVSEFSDITICGCRHGYFNPDENVSIISEINSSGADILLVALGAPRQEEWIHANKKDLKVKVCISVGGSLDVFAGKAKLAPDFFRNNSLEWFYRLCKDPRRIRRMIKLPVFVLKVVTVALKNKSKNISR